MKVKKLSVMWIAAMLFAAGFLFVGCGDSDDPLGNGGGTVVSVFDFQAWMAAHNAQHPRGDLPLPAGADAAANPSHLGGVAQGGHSPFWNSGNQNIVIEGPVAARDGYQMAVPGGGQHGVTFLLISSSFNARVGDTVRIAGYMRGTITANHAEGPGVGLRRWDGNSPGDNIESVRWAPGLTDHPFEISRVLTQQDFAMPGQWFQQPVLTVVREPTQGGVLMIIQEFEVTGLR